MKSNPIYGRCEKCEYARVLGATGGWSFVGCRHEPYRDKWVAEIKDCPKASNTK